MCNVKNKSKTILIFCRKYPSNVPGTQEMNYREEPYWALHLLSITNNIPQPRDTHGTARTIRYRTNFNDKKPLPKHTILQTLVVNSFNNVLNILNTLTYFSKLWYLMYTYAF
jgi:hypothetical protein